MCGRIEYNVTSRKKLEDHYGAVFVEGITEQGFWRSRYNIAPRTLTPIITEDSKIMAGHWGFKPEWAAGKPKIKEVINARIESVREKPYFRSAINKQRCLLPVTAFYEWRREEKIKIPYRFFKDDEIFSLGCLYSTLDDEKGSTLPHYAIVTKEANDIMKPVHNRMPLIIDKKYYAAWLDSTLPFEKTLNEMKLSSDIGLKKYRVSPLVNNPRNDRPEIIKPVSE